MTLTMFTAEKMHAVVDQMKHDLVVGFVAPVYPLRRPPSPAPEPPTMPEDRLARDLLRTAALLERDGWTRSSWHDDLGRWCITGALSWVTTGREVPRIGNSIRYRDAAKYFCEHLGLEPRRNWFYTILNNAKSRASVPDYTTTLMTWNDAKERTRGQVIRAVREAADQRILETTH